MIKWLAVCMMLLAPVEAMADRTIVSPSGYTMPSGYDGELFEAISHQSRTVALLDAGSADLQVEGAYLGRPGIDRLSISCQGLILPETFVTPAVSVGVRDIGNSAGSFASDGFYGRGYYLVVTKSLDNGVSPPKIHGITLTAGVGAGSYHGPFGGAGVDLPLRLNGTAEYDGRTMNYRIALPISQVARFSINRISNSTCLSLDIHSRISL